MTSNRIVISALYTLIEIMEIWYYYLVSIYLRIFDVAASIHMDRRYVTTEVPNELHIWRYFATCPQLRSIGCRLEK